MSSDRGCRLDGRATAATEVRELAEPLAKQPDAASTPLDDPPGTIRLRGSIARADVAGVCARAAGAFAAAGAGTGGGEFPRGGGPAGAVGAPPPPRGPLGPARRPTMALDPSPPAGPRTAPPLAPRR